MTITINITETICQLDNHERYELLGLLMASISEEGIVEKMRAIVNDHQWDDQESCTSPGPSANAPEREIAG